MNATPPIPQGTSDFHRWAKWMHEKVLAARVTDAPGMVTHRTTRGVVQVPKRPSGGAAPASTIYPVWL